MALLLVPLVALADYSYDWTTGNWYITTPNADGGAQVHVYNGRTDSSWNTTIFPNGDIRGFDSNGNVWQYNSSTGYYVHSKGQACIGKGERRRCWLSRHARQSVSVPNAYLLKR
jgi:hypothetical protein